MKGRLYTSQCKFNSRESCFYDQMICKLNIVVKHGSWFRQETGWYDCILSMSVSASMECDIQTASSFCWRLVPLLNWCLPVAGVLLFNCLYRLQLSVGVCCTPLHAVALKFFSRAPSSDFEKTVSFISIRIRKFVLLVQNQVTFFCVLYVLLLDSHAADLCSGVFHAEWYFWIQERQAGYPGALFLLAVFHLDCVSHVWCWFAGTKVITVDFPIRMLTHFCCFVDLSLRLLLHQVGTGATFKTSSFSTLGLLRFCRVIRRPCCLGNIWFYRL